MLKSIIGRIDKGFDQFKFKIKKKLNLFDPIFIYPYRSYGYNGTIYLRGRVLEKERVIHEDDTEDSLFKNLSRFFKRYESDEIPGVKLKITFQGKSFTTITDDEGFYYLEIPYDSKVHDSYWEVVKIRIIESPVPLQDEVVEAEGEVMIPSKATFGVISDVDDTIIVSHATNVMLKLKMLAFGHYNTRVAFPGIASFYNGLIKAAGEYKNPLWFISGSSWNLYDLLKRFCEDKGIPKGTFLLRSLEVSNNKFIKDTSINYKLNHIRPLMESTAPLPMILIGDSGQKDVETYEKIADEFHDRIKAIYIRDVTDKEPRVHEAIKRLKKKNIDMILASDTSVAAKHALKNQWITEDLYQKVKKEIDKLK